MVAVTSTAAVEDQNPRGVVVVGVPPSDPPNLLATDLLPQTCHRRDISLVNNVPVSTVVRGRLRLNARGSEPTQKPPCCQRDIPKQIANIPSVTSDASLL